MNRRQLFVTAATAALAGLAAAPALALSAADARRLIDAAVADLNGVINSGGSGPAMYGEFQRIFQRYADVPTIARSALGPEARGASGPQLSAFTDAFAGYMARKYGARFREFIGGQIVVRDARPVQSFIEVQTTAELRGQAPFAVTFLVSDRSGEPRFFDLLIEGISLLRTERTEIGAMLDRRRGNIEQLVEDLRQAG